MRKMYICVAIAVVLVFLTLFFFFPRKKVVLTIKICDEFQTESLSYLCKSIFKGELEACKNIPHFSTICYEGILKRMRNRLNYEFCDSLTDNYAKSVCFFELAVRDSDINLCSKTTEARCIYEIAVKRGNPKLCDEIEDEIIKYKCLAVLKGEIAHCEKILDSFERASCEAFFSNNPEICNGDIDCLFTMAMSTKDQDICNLIDSELLRFTCLMKISNSMEACNGATISYVRDLCKLEYIKANLP